MAYGKLQRFAQQCEDCRSYLDENMIFEAWIVYIRENPKDADDIINDIDQEMMTKRGQTLLTESEWQALQYEAMDYLNLRRWN